ncbi:hypothetical protein MUG78_16985 [Gordonia alkaliphila]|uniref:hypothetical protein n=1 Tax=Gordonia alkaliphila TaxID=1053547 RepID=UPI001FF49B44|nr:hypothetical protein [Gordonia alkaliphila]MCK0441097.1 hypothetical protein [Gordonia alkaliphila]
MPCQHAVIDQIAAESAHEMERYSDPSVCPACRQVITRRQKTVVFDRNLYGLGVVVFHTRQLCLAAAADYDKRVHREDQQYQLNCPGQMLRAQSRSGTFSCCTQRNCRGAKSPHAGGIRWQSLSECPDGYFPVRF